MAKQLPYRDILGVQKYNAICGVFTADNARKRLANMAASTSEDLNQFIVKKYYTVDITQVPALGLVSRMLDISPFVVIVESVYSTKKPIGVLTSEDLLQLVTDKSLNLSCS